MKSSKKQGRHHALPIAIESDMLLSLSFNALINNYAPQKAGKKDCKSF